MTDPHPPAEQKTLSRDLADFLIEFSIAINKYAMYPGGHPSLLPSAERVVKSLQSLMVERGTLSLGVARQQLIIEGVATNPKNPVLGVLAGRLHRHELGAITFQRGLDPLEMQDALAVIAQEADHMEQPLGAQSIDELPQWANIKLYPLNYERLDLLDDEGAEDADEEGKAARTRAAQLWVGLARAAVAGEERGQAPQPETLESDEFDQDPDAIAKAIGDHGGSTAYDQVIVGYMLQIADELRGGGGREALELKRRMSKMMSSLDAATVDRLLEMGGDRVQRRKFLLDASQGLALDAVVDLIDAAGKTHEQTISHSMLRMLQKMAQHSQSGHGAQRALAEENARAQIATLIGDWTLEDPNPDAYRMALERMAAQESLIRVSPEQQYRPEPKRIIQMAIEVDETGEPLWEAIRQLSDAIEFAWVLNAIRQAKGTKIVHEFWEQFGTTEQLRVIASAEPLDTEALETMVAKMGPKVAPVLLDVMADSESSQTRHFLVGRLAKFGPMISAEIIGRLGDERWFVVRNLLCIMSEWSEMPEGFEGRKYLKHPDARVRREALKVMLKDPAEREHTLTQAISDEDQTMVRAGLGTALDGCPDRVIPIVITKATSAPTGELRTLAIKVLAGSQLLMARKALVDIVPLRKKFFRLKLPPKSPELLAAIGALREMSDDPRAKRILDLAQKSKDPDIARAASGGS